MAFSHKHIWRHNHLHAVSKRQYAVGSFRDQSEIVPLSVACALAIASLAAFRLHGRINKLLKNVYPTLSYLNEVICENMPVDTISYLNVLFPPQKKPVESTIKIIEACQIDWFKAFKLLCGVK